MNKNQLKYPIKFIPILKEKIWGGNKLTALLNKANLNNNGKLFPKDLKTLWPKIAPSKVVINSFRDFPFSNPLLTMETFRSWKIKLIYFFLFFLMA